MNNLNDIISCSSCELYKSCSRPIPVKIIGNNPEIIFYADRPTSESDLMLEAFEDRSERNIIRIIKNKFNSFAVGYLLKCKNTLKGKRLTNSLEFCSEKWVEKEIKFINPKAIIALGETSYNYLVKKWIENSKFKNQIGKIYTRPDNIIISGWYSPTYLINRSVKTEIDFKKFLDNLSVIMESINVSET